MKNDLISRQEAIDAVHEEFDDCLVWDESGQRTAEEFEIIINRLPSVQSESKKGKWIEAYDPFNRISGRCSVCGWEAHLYEDDVIGMNYCPNCGSYNGGSDD